MIRTRDIGFGMKIGKRLMHPDGSFNVKKINGTRDFFRHLINCHFSHFLGYVLLFYVGINFIFAALFTINGIQHLYGIQDKGILSNLLNAFFFSIQTFTTVGYGAVHPLGTIANSIASIDALTGVFSVAIISGTLLARITQRKNGVVFSKNAVIVPHNGATALMFRIANSHNSEIIEANAKVMVAVFTESNGEYKRSYFPIELERSEVMFFPLSWTLVHMIDEKSPLFSLSIADMEKCETEVIVLISGYDETLNERFYSKHSYTADQFLENHRFLPAFDEGQSGTTMFDVKRIHDTVEWM